jgi:hypothetical protein
MPGGGGGGGGGVECRHTCYAEILAYRFLFLSYGSSKDLPTHFK